MSSKEAVTIQLSKYVRANSQDSVNELERCLLGIAVRHYDDNAIKGIVDLMDNKESAVYVTLSDKSPRSRTQEGYYRKWSRAFGEFCGMTPDEMHNEILFQTFGTIEIETRFGWKKRPNKRSGNTTKQEFGNLIETLIRTAAEMGFNVPPPDREHHDEKAKN
tara:strand:+ start:39 stop:524 length:486 start_codon:yes stop_codon:yes gene_type:complete